MLIGQMTPFHATRSAWQGFVMSLRIMQFQGFENGSCQIRANYTYEQSHTQTSSHVNYHISTLNFAEAAEVTIG